MDQNCISKAETPEVAYHYTSVDIFKLIIEGQRLRFGHIRPQNDKQEVTYFQDIASEFVQEGLQTQNQQIDYAKIDQPFLFEFGVSNDERSEMAAGYKAYVVCFSEDQDCKSQWKEYGANYTGVSSGFRASYFEECGFERLEHTLGNSIGFFEHIAYDDPKTIKDLLLVNLAGDTVRWFIGIWVLQHLHKSPLWEEEREWRLCYMPPMVTQAQTFAQAVNAQDARIRKHVIWKEPQPTRYSGEQVLPFLCLDRDPSPIAEVVLGPNCLLSESQIAEALDSAGIESTNVEICRSGLHIRQ